MDKLIYRFDWNRSEDLDQSINQFQSLESCAARGRVRGLMRKPSNKIDGKVW